MPSIHVNLIIKDTTESSISASYLDCYLNVDNGKLITRLYDKRDDFNFPIANFPFINILNSNIPSAPAYVVYASQLVCYARACCNYEDFVDRGKLLTSKLLSQGYRRAKLVSTLKKSYGRHYNLVDPYSVAASKLVSDLMPIANKYERNKAFNYQEPWYDPSPFSLICSLLLKRIPVLSLFNYRTFVSYQIFIFSAL